MILKLSYQDKKFDDFIDFYENALDVAYAPDIAPTLSNLHNLCLNLMTVQMWLYRLFIISRYITVLLSKKTLLIIACLMFMIYNFYFYLLWQKIV